MISPHSRTLALAGARSGAIVAVLALAAKLTRQPLVFPSLGPTAFLLAASPGQASVGARPVIGGHVIGIASGFTALVLFGLRSHPGALVEGVSPARIGAAALCVTLTTVGMLATRSVHPPAAASSLIVALGLIRDPAKVTLMVVAVVALWALGTLLGRVPAAVRSA